MRPAILSYGGQSIGAAERREVLACLRSAWLTQGPRVQLFEEALAARTQSRHAVAFSSGTAALHGACHVAGVAGGVAVTSPISFVASANSALYAGGDASFADVDPTTGNMDPEALSRSTSPSPRVVLPVHLAGLPARVREIASAVPPGTIIVEDAAHALGATYLGRPIGACAFSQMATFSFHPVKHITTAEGGAVVTNVEELAIGLRRFRDHGIERRPGVRSSMDPWSYDLVELGYNYRLSDLQCALGLAQLTRLDEFLVRRRELAARYGRELASIPALRLPNGPRDGESSWHLYIVQLELQKLAGSRRDVFEALRAENIGVQVHYRPIHLQPLYRQRYGFSPGAFPQAEAFYERCLSLPLFPRMTDRDARDVIEAVTKVLTYFQPRS